MNIKETIASAGRNLHTIIIKAQEDDGSTETREAEPYSYRTTGGTEKFFATMLLRAEQEIFTSTRSFLLRRLRTYLHLVGKWSVSFSNSLKLTPLAMRT
jgi:hypothetical protein